MRILLSLTYYAPHVSGLTIYVKRLAEELVRKGNRVTVLCWRHEEKISSEEINGVRVVRVNPQIKISKGFWAWEWVTKSWTEVRNHEAVIVNLPQAEGFIPAIISRVLGKKLIAVYHCEIDLPNKAVQRVVEAANRVTLGLADKVITYTRDYADHSKMLRSVMNVECIYPPIPYPITGKFELKKPKSETWVGVAARLAREKGVEYLIGALPLIKKGRCRIVIAGPVEPTGEEDYKKKIMKLVEKWGDRIIFLGTIDPEMMGGFYRAIDVLVLPSVNSTEAFGMVQVEAMMMGVPVVATDLPGVRVPIQKTGMGKLVPPRDSYSLAKAIAEVLEKRNHYRSGAIIAKTVFSLENTIKGYERILRGLVLGD